MQKSEILDHKYLLKRKIGQGGFSLVYEGEHLSLGKQVAIKILSRGGDSKRLKSEARSLAALQHPNIVHVLDFGEDANGLAYCVMEYVEGVTLDKLIRAQAPMRLEQIEDICGQICAALDFMHSRQCIHRDLKPSNIMIGKDTQGKMLVKLFDFGIAKNRSESDKELLNLTRPGLSVGTPYYMSPEQIKGLEEVDHRSDLYALGIILYEMFTGQVPFDAPSRFTLMEKHLHEAPPPIPDTRASSLLQACYQRLLAKDPQARFAGAREAWQALLGALRVCRESGEPSIRERLQGVPVASSLRSHSSTSQPKIPPASPSALRIPYPQHQPSRSSDLRIPYQQQPILAQEQGSEMPTSPQTPSAPQAEEGESMGSLPAPLLQLSPQEEVAHEDSALFIPRVLRERLSSIEPTYTPQSSEDDDEEDTALLPLPDVLAPYAPFVHDHAVSSSWQVPKSESSFLDLSSSSEEVLALSSPRALASSIEESEDDATNLHDPFATVPRKEEDDETKLHASSIPTPSTPAEPDDDATNLHPPKRIPPAKEDDGSIPLQGFANRSHRETSSLPEEDEDEKTQMRSQPRLAEAIERTSVRSRTRQESHLASGQEAALSAPFTPRTPSHPRKEPPFTPLPALSTSHTLDSSRSSISSAFVPMRASASSPTPRPPTPPPSLHSPTPRPPTPPPSLHSQVAQHPPPSKTSPPVMSPQTPFPSASQTPTTSPLGASLVGLPMANFANHAIEPPHDSSDEVPFHYLPPSITSAASSSAASSSTAPLQSPTMGAPLAPPQRAGSPQGGSSKTAPQGEVASYALTQAPPMNAREEHERGMRLGKEGRFEEAVQAFRRALQISPSDASAAFNLGVALGSLGLYGEAEEAFRQAIYMAPHLAAPHYNLGLALSKQHRLLETEEAFRQAIQRDPRVAHYYNDLGIVLGKQNRYKEAEEIFRKAIALAPKDTTAYFNLGTAFGQQGQYERAAEVFYEALAIQPEEPALYLQLSYIQKAQGHDQEAMRSFLKAQALSSKQRHPAK